jgi:molybdopterin/thiamine biosynthesis adenylyltransferase
VGKLKVQVAKKRLQEFNPAIRCKAFTADITKQRALSEALKSDVIVACVDRVRPRRTLHRACWESGKMLLDLGAGV